MKVIIIGGDAAGMSAAMEIVRNKKGATVMVLERGDVYSYGQCGLPYIIDGRIPHTDELISKDVEVFRNKYGIDARVFHEVQYVNSTMKTVVGIDVTTNKSFEYHYDKLLIASGASPIMPPWSGTNLAGIHTVKTIPQMQALMADLQRAQHVTVIGAGYIGLEVVETLRAAGKSVRLIQRGQQVMKLLDQPFQPLLQEALLKHEVEVCLNEEVIGFKGENRVQQVVTKQGLYDTELVIVATGIRPNTQFIQGMAKLENGAIIVNERMETSLPNIYAAGDCATHFHRIKQMDDYIALGTTANKQGRIAGRNMAGMPSLFKGIVGTSILQLFHLQIGMTGISEREAEKLGIDAISYRFEANNMASYYPGVKPLYMHVLVEKDSHKLLGLQMVGAEGVDKRVDVFATALYAGLTFEEYVDLDLAYSPPFNGVWDTVQKVAKRYYRE